MDIRAIAVKATQLSELMEDRDKIETEDIIKYYPDGITIIGADPITLTNEKGEESSFWVYIFYEDENKFAFSGFVLNKIFDNVLEQCDGDLDEMNKELEKGELRVKLSTGKTKSKQQITNVKVL